MAELTEDIKRLQERMDGIRSNARSVQFEHPGCTGTWWKIENAPLPAMQYLADKSGQKLDYDENNQRFRWQASEYERGINMTLFIYSTPVKVTISYEEVGNGMP